MITDAIPVATGLGFFQPIQPAQHVRLPGTAGGVGHFALVQISGDIFQAETEDIELVLPRESAPLFIGMAIDPL